MNDPHVTALYYKVIIGKDVDYNNAPSLTESTAEFEFSFNGKTAIFNMKQHYSSADEAKAVVEPYLRAWDILIGLLHDPEDLQLKYHHADIIDRSPDTNKKNTINLRAHISGHLVVSGKVSLHVSRGKFPPFPKNFKASPDAETMYLRYKSYREGRESLTAMAYMCLSVFQASAGGRKEAADIYNIDYEILDTLGRLISTKGGPEEARKFPKYGKFDPLHPKEKEWIVSVVKTLIRRAGEYAYDNEMKLNQISIKDFQELP
jgi:hypothetical protein